MLHFVELLSQTAQNLLPQIRKVLDQFSQVHNYICLGRVKFFFHQEVDQDENYLLSCLRTASRAGVQLLDQHFSVVLAVLFVRRVRLRGFQQLLFDHLDSIHHVH